MRISKKTIAVAFSLSLIISIGGLIYYFVSQPPPVLITYHGENTVPEGLVGFPTTTNQPFFYSWNLTMTNLNPASGIGVPAERALQRLVSKYPQLVTVNMYIPGEGYTGNLTLLMDVTAFNGNMAKQCFVLFAKSQLSSDQIISLTEDLNTYLAPALIEWYS
ncbi:MAG: hypothetical protein NWE99_04190 [Candidatus Bathyarchaeota archaeon]|nr:hypothetical protein [Candidatus Bathyarchaeota archaeon]